MAGHVRLLAAEALLINCFGSKSRLTVRPRAWAGPTTTSLGPRQTEPLSLPCFQLSSSSSSYVVFGGGAFLRGQTQQRRRRQQRRQLLVCQSSVHAHHAHGHAAYPQALVPLYSMYAFACMVERTWRFALPLVLAHIPGGFQAIAILGFASPLAATVFVPVLGQLLDKTYRPYGLGAMLCLQDLSIMASCGALIAAAARPVGTALVDSPLFYLLVLLSMVERLTSSVSELIIERDWVAQIAGKQNAQALATCNATLKRTDLICELLGSIAFGCVYSRAGLGVSMVLTSLVALAALPLQCRTIYKIASVAPGAMVHGRQEVQGALFKPQWRFLLPHHASPRTPEEQQQWQLEQQQQRKEAPAPVRRPLLAQLEERIAHSMDGWKVYFRQPIFASSLAYVLLFFNVVLSPVGLIFPFLASWGMGGMGSAVFKGGCAVCGFIGTWIGKAMIQRVGLLRAGQNALLIQVVLLSAAAALFFNFLSGPPELGIGGALAGGGGPAAAAAAALPSVGGVALPVVAFAACVVLSRMGVWCYEMVNAQLFQQTVAQREMSSASSAEMALCSFAELSMLGVAAYSADPSSFGKLVCGSLGAVVIAAVLFTLWARRTEQDADGGVARTRMGGGQVAATIT